MNIIVIILLGIALWIIYSLMESYNLLLKEVKQLKSQMGKTDKTKADEYILQDKALQLKDKLRNLLKILLSV